MKTFYTILTAAFILAATPFAFAQTKTVRLLNKKEQEVQAISDAHYFEIIEANTSGGGVKSLYLLKDSVKVSTSSYSDLHGGTFKLGVLHGPYFKWYESGKAELEANYADGKLNGNYKRWFENGQLNYEVSYRDGVKHDTLTVFYETGELRRKEVFDLGKLVGGKLYDRNGKELKFFPMEQMPEFVGGEMQMMKWLAKNVRYPGGAMRNKAQGVVYVAFVVGKDGAISEAEIIKGVHPEIDAEAKRVVMAMPNWEPGKQEGEPVRVRYTIPLKFSLR